MSLLALLLGGCATAGKDYRAPSPPELGVPDRYFGPAPGGEAVRLSNWWEQLGDPLLDSLVARAVAGNLDLAVAESRLRQAREALVQARAARLPTIGASGGLGQSLDSRGNADTNLSLGADAAWEADLFGGITRGIEASRADAAAVAFDLAAVRVAIVGEVATNYIEARQAQARLATARDTLAIADDNLQITRWRVQAGLVSSLDVEQARGQRAQTAASIPSLERDFAAAAYRIAVLTGQAPGSVSGELQAVRPIPLGPAEIATGIPAETLRNRPDVRSAERSLAAATARIGVAQAALLPNLRLTGNIGTSGLSLGSLVDAVTGSLFASLGQTLFDGGRLRRRSDRSGPRPKARSPLIAGRSSPRSRMSRTASSPFRPPRRGSGSSPSRSTPPPTRPFSPEAPTGPGSPISRPCSRPSALCFPPGMDSPRPEPSRRSPSSSSTAPWAAAGIPSLQPHRTADHER